MADTDTRVRCPWCMTQVHEGASICHGCGAIRARPPLSMIQIFFIHPLAAFALMLAGLAVLGLHVVMAAAVFGGAWMAFSLVYVLIRLRLRWLQVEPLLLEDEPDDAYPATHKAPAGWAPWWAGAATVATALAVIWAASPPPAVVEAKAAVILSIAPTVIEAPARVPAIAPINVVAVSPPRAALPPTVPTPDARSTRIEPPKAEMAKVTIAPADTSKLEGTKTEVAKTEPPKAEPTADAQILAAQRLLVDLGYFDGSADGKMGAKMRAAVKEFRADMSLGGEAVDARLIATLESVMSARQQAEARRAQQAEAKRPEPKRAAMKPADAVQAEAKPVLQAEAIPPQNPAPPLSSPAVFSPPPLAVLNGLSAARAATQAQDQGPVRLAPVRLR